MGSFSLTLRVIEAVRPLVIPEVIIGMTTHSKTHRNSTPMAMPETIMSPVLDFLGSGATAPGITGWVSTGGPGKGDRWSTRLDQRGFGFGCGVDAHSDQHVGPVA